MSKYELQLKYEVQICRT